MAMPLPGYKLRFLSPNGAKLPTELTLQGSQLISWKDVKFNFLECVNLCNEENVEKCRNINFYEQQIVGKDLKTKKTQN